MASGRSTVILKAILKDILESSAGAKHNYQVSWLNRISVVNELCYAMRYKACFKLLALVSTSLS